MSAEEKLFKALSSSTTLAALVGERIFPVPLPQSVSLSPSLTYERNGGSREYTLKGYAGLENPQMTVTIYVSTRATGQPLKVMDAVTTAVHEAVENTTAFSSINLSGYEDEWDDELQQRARFIDFSIWNRE
jgi:hypothetical protein